MPREKIRETRKKKKPQEGKSEVSSSQKGCIEGGNDSENEEKEGRYEDAEIIDDSENEVNEGAD